MENTLTITYLNTEAEIAEIDKELDAVEARLVTPERTVEDIIKHMQLLKHRNALMLS